MTNKVDYPDSQLIKKFASLYKMCFEVGSITPITFLLEVEYLIEKFHWGQIIMCLHDHGLWEEIDKLAESVKHDKLVWGMEIDSKAETERRNRCAKLWRECGWHKTK